MCCIVDLDALFRVEFTDKRTRIGLMMYCSPLNNASIFFWGGGGWIHAPSPLAFQRGHIVRGNEVVTFLGDTYFAEQTASSASGFVSRRMSKIESEIK